MKNMENLISKSLGNNFSVADEDKLSNKVKKADDIINSIENANTGGEKKLVQNVTFALTKDDVKLINEQIKRYMLKEGEAITKSLLVRAALHLFSTLSDGEIKDKLSLVRQIERGRPRGKK